MMAIPWAREISGVNAERRSPWTRTSPASGTSAPARIFIRVDFPAPFSPTIAWISPRRTARETPSRACTPGKALETQVIVRASVIDRAPPNSGGRGRAPAAPSRYFL